MSRGVGFFFSFPLITHLHTQRNVVQRCDCLQSSTRSHFVHYQVELTHFFSMWLAPLPASEEAFLAWTYPPCPLSSMYDLLNFHISSSLTIFQLYPQRTMHTSRHFTTQEQPLKEPSSPQCPEALSWALWP